ncbi:MAG: ABC transporter substrate-binding protein [candidate division WOR-3 bacterium]
MRKFLIFFFLFLLCKEKRELKVAILFELTGKYSNYANEALLGVDFFKKNNLKLPFEIEIFDFKSDSENLKIKIEEILKDEKFLCIIGPLISKFALYASSLCEENKIPLITPTATSPFIKKDKNYIYSMTYSDIDQAKAIAKFAIEYYGIDKFAIIYKKDEPYSKVLFEEFKKSIQEMGGKTLAVEEFDRENIISKISYLKKVNPSGIFAPLYAEEAIFFVKKCIGENFTPIFLGGDGWYSEEVVKELKNYSKKEIKVFISSPFHPDIEIEEYRDFINEFEIEYGKKPNFLSALSYESVHFLSKCFENLRFYNRENLNNSIKKLYVQKKKVWILKLKEEGFDVIFGI